MITLLLMHSICYSHVAAVDIIFVIDGSDAMGKQNFITVLDFVLDIVNAFPISVEGVHVGLVIITDKAVMSFQLNLYTDKSTLNSVIRQTYYPGGKTDTGDAIAKAKYMFMESKREAAKVKYPMIIYILTLNIALAQSRLLQIIPYIIPEIQIVQSKNSICTM